MVGIGAVDQSGMGGARDEGMGVPTGARATMFVTDGTARKQQTKKKSKKPATKRANIAILVQSKYAPPRHYQLVAKRQK